MHQPPPHHRAIGFVFPAIIVVIAAYAFPIFASTERAWWLIFIIGPGALIAVLVCMDFLAMSIGFDARGVHYCAVGYRIYAPWAGLKYHANGGKPVLQVTQGERHLFPWFGLMYNTLALIQPRQTRHASQLMTSIPLHFFMTAGTDAVMRDLRASAPAGFA